MDEELRDSNIIIIEREEDYKDEILTEQFRDIWNRAASGYEEISKQVSYWISRP